ncbi:MAG: nuclear transport factor 2 family protein [Chitinophagaceae bacterium]|nr:MAG: nuclear transport factor 2 family protein [Chitinophagaceae bacterium]
MQHTSFLLFLAIAIFGCQQNVNEEQASSALNKSTTERQGFVELTRKIEDSITSIHINTYHLITDNPGRDTLEADALLRRKILHPLAMQKHDSALFEDLLAVNFTAQGEQEFFNRQEFIRDRVNGKWMISDVQYENLVLQFFGETGILTYRNIVKELDEKGLPKTWHFTWTDARIKEEGKWRIKTQRTIFSTVTDGK